jgi:hypothetical protein
MTMEATVVNFPTPKPRLECKQCGATTEAKCDCGVEYVLVRPGEIAEKAIMENPEQSDRAIAAQIGVNNSTVSRARKSVVANATPAKRIGKDGKTYSAKKSTPGLKFIVPAGYEKFSEAIFAAVESERNGKNKSDIAKDLNISTGSYMVARDIVLLARVPDLSSNDHKIVNGVLAHLDRDLQIAGAREKIAPIARKVWGPKGNRFKANPLTEHFLGSISLLLTMCTTAAELPIPHLNALEKQTAIAELKEAERTIVGVRNRLYRGD